MKRLWIGTAAMALTVAVAAPSLACQGEHGYLKTAQMLQQSTISTQQKAALMQVIADSKADHDKYTATGEYGKMNDAVDELAEVKSQLTK